jgi:hypothetical protein
LQQDYIFEIIIIYLDTSPLIKYLFRERHYAAITACNHQPAEAGRVKNPLAVWAIL